MSKRKSRPKRRSTHYDYMDEKIIEFEAKRQHLVSYDKKIRRYYLKRKLLKRIKRASADSRKMVQYLEARSSFYENNSANSVPTSPCDTHLQTAIENILADIPPLQGEARRG